MNYGDLRRGPWLAWSLAVGVFVCPASAAPAPDAVTVAFALDTSGSITKEELQQARALITSVFQGLPAGSEAALFTFDDTERLLLPWTATPADLERTLAIVGPTGRFTALHDALYEASRKLHDTRTGRKALVLVTDGKDEGSTLTLEDGLRVAQDSRFPVWVVGVGHVQEKVLRRIAKLTAGEYVALKGASGSGVAAKIVSVMPAPEAPAAASVTAPAVPAAAPNASAGKPAGSSSATAPAAAPRPEKRTSAMGLWIAVGLGVAATAGIGYVAVRRRARNRCPSCGFDLAGSLSACTYCSADKNARIAEHAGSTNRFLEPTLHALHGNGNGNGHHGDAIVHGSAAAGNVTMPPSGNGLAHDASGLSEHAIAHMNMTEEFLEKTVTLQERPVLVITGGPGSGRVFSLSHESTTCLGRAKLNDIVLDDISVSSEHCRIRPEEGGFVVHDLKSTNGTYINEKKVAHHPLAAGDVLKVGETSMQLRLDHQRAS